MSLSDQVAVTALVISLIALAISFAQLVGQLFSTADGYRRCSPSVIGAWHTLRRRNFLLSEMRFEVQYMTPHIAIISADSRELLDIATFYGPAYFLTCPTADSHQKEQPPPHGLLPSAISFLLPWKNWKRERHEEHILTVLKDTPAAGATVSAAASKQDSPKQNTHHDEEKQLQDQASHGISDLAAQRLRSEVLASWMRLLSESHATYRQYWPGAVPSPGAKATERTELAVAVRQWTWDFMPADQLRPLATSSLNHVILMAMRMEMQWRKLDLENGIFLADGNGYAFSSVYMRGLGIVFHFGVHGKQTPHRPLVPCASVDKMMFGIIPGCPALVQRDFDVIDAGSRADIDSLLEDVGVEDWKVRKEIVSKRYWEPRNEMIVLLCSFLPLPEDHNFRHSFPAWLGPVGSVFHFWEGRAGLLQELERRTDALPAREWVLDELNGLRAEFHNEFYCIWRHSILYQPKDTVTPAEKREFLAGLRRIFDSTTSYFEGKHRSTDFNWSTSDGRARTWYVELVGAHACMSHTALPLAQEAGRRQRQTISPDNKQLKAHFGFADIDKRGYFRHNHLNLASEYASQFRREDDEDGVVSLLRQRGIDLEKQEIETAWWVLMLRGIVWDMSTANGPDPARWDGLRVPSSFYHTKSPVWIT